MHSISACAHAPIYLISGIGFPWRNNVDNGKEAKPFPRLVLCFARKRIHNKMCMYTHNYSYYMHAHVHNSMYVMCRMRERERTCIYVGTTVCITQPENKFPLFSDDLFVPFEGTQSEGHVIRSNSSKKTGCGRESNAK